jgi:hypothetical protein
MTLRSISITTVARSSHGLGLRSSLAWHTSYPTNYCDSVSKLYLARSFLASFFFPIVYHFGPQPIPINRFRSPRASDVTFPGLLFPLWSGLQKLWGTVRFRLFHFPMWLALPPRLSHTIAVVTVSTLAFPYIPSSACSLSQYSLSFPRCCLSNSDPLDVSFQCKYLFRNIRSWTQRPASSNLG